MKTYFYDLRFNSYEWARIWITSDGMISICSDYGNYGYWFGAPAVEIRRFLCGVDPGVEGYMAIKLADGRRNYSGDKTLKSVRECILAQRRGGDMTREEARDEWELLGNHSNLEHSENFAQWYLETELTDVFEHRVEQIPGQLQGFMTHAWPRLVEVMRREIDEEDARALAMGVMQEMGV